MPERYTWCWKSLGSGTYWSTGDGCIWLEGQLNGEGKLYGNSCLFFIKIFKILKKKGFSSQGQSTTGECCDWARVHSAICLFSLCGKLYRLLLMGVGYCSSMSYHVLPSSSDSKYRFVFYIVFSFRYKTPAYSKYYIYSTLHLKQFKRKNIPLTITSIMLL